MAEKAVSVPFLAGFGQDVDQRVAPGGVLETATNVYPVKAGRLARRAGYDAGPSTAYTSDGAAWSVYAFNRVGAAHDGREVVQSRSSASAGHVGRPDPRVDFLARSASSYVTSTAMSNLAICGPLTRSLAGSAENSSGYAQVASWAGYELTAIAFSGYFKATLTYQGRRVFSFSESANVSDVRAWHWPGTNRLCVGYHNSSNHALYCVYVDVVSNPRLAVGPTQLGTLQVNTLTEPASAQMWDVVALEDSVTFPSHVAVLARTRTTSCFQVVSHLGAVTSFPLDRASDRMCALGVRGEHVYCLTGRTTGTYIDAQVLELDTYDPGEGTYTLTAHTVGTFATAPTHGTISGIAGITGAGAFVALTTTGATPETGESTTFYAATGGGSAALYTEVGARLASTIFCEDGMAFAWVAYNLADSFQRGRYLIGVSTLSTRAILARAGWGVAWDSAVTPLLRPAWRSTDSRFVEVFQEIAQGLNGSPSTAELAFYRYDHEMSSRERGAFVSLAGTVISGGALLHFDGEHVHEQGWFQYPGAVWAAQTAGTGFPAGTYTYVVVYEEDDLLGNVHQSPPSETVTATVAAEIDYITVTAYAPTMTMRGRGYNPTLRVAVYRTTSNGTLFRRVGATPCSADGSLIAVVDSLTDTALESQEALRSSAGELEECAPPGAYALAVHGRRLFAGCGDELWFTKEVVPGFAHGWSSANVVKCPVTINALASCGDSLLILGEEECWMLWGVGPDRLGTGYYDPPTWKSSVGCPRALGGSRACAETSMGVIWRGASGLYLMPPGGSQPELISAPIEDTLVTYPIVTAIVDDPEMQCVHVHLAASETDTAASVQVCWWYGGGAPIWTQWSSTTLGVHSSCLVSGDHVYSSTDVRTSRSFVYTPGTSVDDALSTVGTLGEMAVIPSIKTRTLYPFGRASEGRVRAVVVDGQNSAATTPAATITYTIDGTSHTARTLNLPAAGGNFSVLMQPARQRGTFWTVELSSMSNGVEFAGLTFYSEMTSVRRPHTTTQRF